MDRLSKPSLDVFKRQDGILISAGKERQLDVLLEAVPPHIALEAVRASIAAVPGVASVHDLHVWTVTSGMVAMSVHVVVPDGARHQDALEQIHAAMATYGIGHVTVQVEGRALAECAPEVPAVT